VLDSERILNWNWGFGTSMRYGNGGGRTAMMDHGHGGTRHGQGIGSLTLFTGPFDQSVPRYYASSIQSKSGLAYLLSEVCI